MSTLARREYGKTGVKLSIWGFGGIVVNETDQANANRVVAQAVERGVNYFDVAPSYGTAEVQLGPALEPYRKDCFLACKTMERSAQGSAAQMASSMERLKTDHFDLYQLHGLSGLEEVDEAFAKGGAMETFIQARKDGRVRFLGFSAHSEEAALAAMDRFDFDSALFPVNAACWMNAGFGPRIMERAQAKGVARLALKAMGRQKWPAGQAGREKFKKCWYEPISDPHEAQLAVWFTLSQPITAAVSPSEEKLFWMGLEAAENFRPLTPAQMQELTATAGGLAPIFP